MFTGIIQAIGTVRALHRRESEARIEIATGALDMSSTVSGDSIAVNGVCLTVVACDEAGFAGDVSAETLRKTALGQLASGAPVNLELALTPTSRLGGHLVSGHVDGVGRVVSREKSGDSVIFRFEAPADLARYIAKKGSICIDGVSLTVNQINGATFEVNIVPHTLQETIIAGYTPGAEVNLEVDLVARYLERLLLGAQAAQPDAEISEAFLAEHGFLKARDRS